MAMKRKGHTMFSGKKMRGSLTVEAALTVPVVLFSLFWMIERGIILYKDTVKQINQQEMWEEFHPAQKFRELELLEQLF